MTPDHLRPAIGAALTIPHLPHWRDWLIEARRDLEIQDFADVTILNGDISGPVDEALRLLDGHEGRLGIHGPFWGFTIDSHDPDVRAVVQRRLQRGLDVCEALGAEWMVIHSPYTTWDHNNLDNDAAARDALIGRTHATLKDVVRRAEDIGVTLVIENIEDKDPRDRVALARSFGSSAVKVSLDTGHAQYAHIATGAPPVDYHVFAAGDLLHHIHVQDADGYADRHWPPGAGTVPWIPLFEAVARLGTSPRMVLELRDQDKIGIGAAHLAGLGLCR